MYLNNFQSYVFGSILLLIMAFAACDKVETGTPIKAFGEKAELSVNDKVWFGADTVNGLKTLVTEISDSRCPENAQCVWVGEAIVKLKINSLTDSTSVNLKIAPVKTSVTDTINFGLNSKTYRAILYSVNPYSNTDEPVIKKIATISISKK